MNLKKSVCSIIYSLLYIVVGEYLDAYLSQGCERYVKKQRAKGRVWTRVPEKHFQQFLKQHEYPPPNILIMLGVIYWPSTEPSIKMCTSVN